MHKLIINADDFGLSHEVNEAIAYCFDKHYINQTTIMVNMPFLDEAVELAKKHGFCDKVGLHLNLVEGKPLTDNIRNTILCNEDAFFVSSALKATKNRFFLNEYTRKCVCEEIVAQIDKYLKLKIGRMHIDSHQHAHTSPSILRLLIPILREYKFKDIRLSRNIPPSGMGGAKKIVKYLINKEIKRFNKDYSDCMTYAFGSINDVAKTKSLPELTEMMIHPIMRDFALKEAFADGNIEEWWAQNKEKYILV